MVIPLHPLAFFDLLSGPELIVILAVVLIFFGGEKMPEFARGLGKVMRELRKATGDVEREFKRVIEEAEHPPATDQAALKVAAPEYPPAPYEPHTACPEDAAGTGQPEHAPAPDDASESPSLSSRVDPKPPPIPEL